MIYADDTDFISRLMVELNDIEIKASDILQAWNLTINKEKTERTTIRRETNREGEQWRKIKKIGTLLEDSEEMRQRKQLAMVSLKNMWTTCAARRLTKYKSNIRLTNYITPVLMYNAGTQKQKCKSWKLFVANNYARSLECATHNTFQTSTSTTVAA